MDLTEDQQKSLISILNEWVKSSRLNKHIHHHACFVYYSEGRIHFDLKLLHEDYMLKFVFCNNRSYMNSLLDHIQPSLKRWLIRNNVEEYDFSFEFKYAGEVTAKDIKVILTSTLQHIDLQFRHKKFS